MTLFERLNLEHEFSGLNLKGLSALQRKMLIDLIRQRHPQFWRRFRSNAYSWTTTKEQLNQFINLHPSELIAELKKTGFSETVNQNGEAYV